MGGEKSPRHYVRLLLRNIDDICDPYTFIEANGLSQAGMKEGKFIAAKGNGEYQARQTPRYLRLSAQYDF